MNESPSGVQVSGPLPEPGEAPGRTIRIGLHIEPEGCWADSPDIPGWAVAAPSLSTLRRMVRDSILWFLYDTVLDETAGQADQPSVPPAEQFDRLMMSGPQRLKP